MRIAENLAFRAFDRPPFTWAKWFLNRGVMRRAARDLIDQFGIKAASADVPVDTLSGGNVQCKVLARELSDRILVMFAGAVRHEAPIAEAERATVGRHMAGHG